jgi:hypothetical protein
VFLPESVAEWISQQMPIGDLGRVHFRIGKRIPFWWLARGRNFAGLTLWNHVFLVEHCWCVEPIDRVTLEIVLHELVHVLQYRRRPFTFPIRYIVDHLRYGYWRNPAETEARAVALQIAQQFERVKN